MTRPPHPGEVLKQYLRTNDITQDMLAKRLRYSRVHVNYLLNKKYRMTPRMALKLSRALNTSAEFWLTLQMRRDLYDERRRR